MHVRENVKKMTVMLPNEIVDIYHRCLYEQQRFLRVVTFMLKNRITNNYDCYHDLLEQSIFKFSHVENELISIITNELSILPTNVLSLEEAGCDNTFELCYYE